MDTALQYDRLQFAVTATFHYLFPQLTMGLALLLVYLRTRDLLSEGDHYHQVARFWTGIFALSFAFGVVTGIPLEFQFGTNWAKFSEYAGGIVGHWRRVALLQQARQFTAALGALAEFRTTLKDSTVVMLVVCGMPR